MDRRAQSGLGSLLIYVALETLPVCMMVVAFCTVSALLSCADEMIFETHHGFEFSGILFSAIFPYY